MTTLVHVPVKLLPHTIPLVRHMITAMLERRPGWWRDEDQVAEYLMADAIQLHLAIDEQNKALAAMLSEIQLTPGGVRVCFVVGIAGEQRRLWTHHLDDFEKWAKERAGCSAVFYMDGRKGWLREEKLKPYRVTYTFSRDIA
jgi:hypothetical protein